MSAPPAKRSKEEPKEEVLLEKVRDNDIQLIMDFLTKGTDLTVIERDEDEDLCYRKTKELHEYLDFIAENENHMVTLQQMYETSEEFAECLINHCHDIDVLCRVLDVDTNKDMGDRMLKAKNAVGYLICIQVQRFSCKYKMDFAAGPENFMNQLYSAIGAEEEEYAISYVMKGHSGKPDDIIPVQLTGDAERDEVSVASSCCMERSKTLQITN